MRVLASGEDSMTTPTPLPPPLDADLEQLLRRMRLPHIRRSAPDVLATARAQRWEPAEVLRTLLGRGDRRPGTILHRHPPGRGRLPHRQNLRRLGPAAVVHPRPHPDTPCAPWNGSAGPRTWWCADRPAPANRCSSKPSAKSAVETGRRVAWFSLEGLGVLVRRHKADDTVTRAIARILRADLVVVDDIGLLPVGPDAAEGLYRLVDAAYERRSVAISSNLHPSGFDELMPKTLATATVDRLMHHAHLCATTGESVRLAQATSGHGVTPLLEPGDQPDQHQQKEAAQDNPLHHLNRRSGGHQQGTFRWPPTRRTHGRQPGEPNGR